MNEEALEVVVVDDDPQALASTSKIIEHAGFRVRSFTDPEVALDSIRLKRPDAVITDLRMPKRSGLELVRLIRAIYSDLPFVVMTAFGEVDDAVRAMKLGAVDFIRKPFRRQDLLDAVRSFQPRAALYTNAGHEFIGSSDAARNVRDFINRVAPHETSILLEGASGVGKELVARSIHQKSARSLGPWVPVNCAAIPDGLFEAEFFGFERGAFTGAHQSKPGLIERANQGTLFLDEVGELPQAMQAKLLRVLQERTLRRLGSNLDRKVDFRVVAATNVPLKEKVRAGQFREDLYYRLEIVSLRIPSLSERQKDVMDLVPVLLDQICKKRSIPIPKFSENLWNELMQHQWPGNVRELSNVLERLIVFTSNGVCDVSGLPPDWSSVDKLHASISLRRENSIVLPIGTPLKDLEELMIRKTLELTEGDKEATARLLGIHARTIYRRLESSKEKEQLHEPAGKSDPSEGSDRSASIEGLSS